MPAEPKFRNPKPHKPEIFVIADISGSVAAFARFTLHLVYAISGQFSKVRSFVFIDGLDEAGQFRREIETHVAKVLAPQGHVVIATSRPAGFDERAEHDAERNKTQRAVV